MNLHLQKPGKNYRNHSKMKCFFKFLFTVFSIFLRKTKTQTIKKITMLIFCRHCIHEYLHSNCLQKRCHLHLASYNLLREYHKFCPTRPRDNKGPNRNNRREWNHSRSIFPSRFDTLNRSKCNCNLSERILKTM